MGIRACQNLKYVPNNLFDKQTNISVLSYCFFICENITSSVPELWLKFPNASKINCFYGCTNASNYSDIPDEWK